MKNDFIFGSDHYVHIKYIDSFKLEEKKFGKIVLSHYNQKNAVYPVFFHWIIALFFYDTAKESPKKINRFISLISYVSFNLFYIIYFKEIDFLFFIKSNILFGIFPFSYAFWNAKNRGISPRGVGLLIGQIFTYVLLFYLLNPSFYLFSILVLIAFLALITSQFANQYIIFLSLILSIERGDMQFIFIPLLSVLCFYLMFPKLAISFYKGQLFHKLNYARFLAPIFILKSRPGIYRDFFFDFWKKIKNFRKDKIGTINYIYTNPLLEIVYGFPFLWILVWNSFNKPINPLYIHFWELILITISIFFLTSFKKTRFLGEPQRYIEFIIPLIVVQYVSTIENSVFWWSTGIVLFFVCTQQLLLYILINKKGNVSYPKYKHILSHIRKEDIVMSNDTNLSKFLMPHCSLVTIDLTRYYKNKKDFLNLTLNNYLITSLEGLIHFRKKYKTSILILNMDLYSVEEHDFLHKKMNLQEIAKYNEIIIYYVY